MAKMTICIGLPASGKSTKAKELVANGNTVRINKDLLRTMLHFDKFSRNNESNTRDAARGLASMYLANDTNIIIDDTNLNPGTLQSWKDLAKQHNAHIEYADMRDVSVEECIRRDIHRKSVGMHVIQKMALQYLNYLIGANVVVCDLDGTLCNISHRQHLAHGETKDWDAFFAGIPDDKLRKDVETKVHYCCSDTNSQLILVSARPEKCRLDTAKWLNDNCSLHYTALIMREDGDKRPDTEVKNDIYDKYLKQLNIVKVFDDRPCVIRMWRDKGLEVVDVGNGVEF